MNWHVSVNPYNATPEQREEFGAYAEGMSRANACRASLAKFGHTILTRSGGISLAELKLSLVHAVDAYLATDEARIEGYSERLDRTLRCLPHQLYISYSSYRPVPVPPLIDSPPRGFKGVFPIIRTNSTLDYVGFGAPPDASLGQDGSLQDGVAISTIIVAPSNTPRAVQLFEGVIEHVLDALDQIPPQEPLESKDLIYGDG